MLLANEKAVIISVRFNLKEENISWKFIFRSYILSPVASVVLKCAMTIE